MKRLFVLIIFFVGCSQPPLKAENTATTEPSMNLFGTVEAWLQTKERADWSVERAIWSDTHYEVIVTEKQNDPATDALLLIVAKKPRGLWMVTEEKPVKADYGWPTN